MVLLQLVDSFVGYFAPHSEQYFTFARQDFAQQLVQNMEASEKLQGVIKMAQKCNPGAQAFRVFPVYFHFFFYLRFGFCFLEIYFFVCFLF